MAKIKLCNYNRLCSKIGLFTNMFMKCSVLIFGGGKPCDGNYIAGV